MKGMKFPAGALFMAASAFAADSIHEFTLKSIDGGQLNLSSYKGKVVLIVNTASH
jgi:glutathione peroxidase